MNQSASMLSPRAEATMPSATVPSATTKVQAASETGRGSRREIVVAVAAESPGGRLYEQRRPRIALHSRHYRRPWGRNLALKGTCCIFQERERTSGKRASRPAVHRMREPLPFAQAGAAQLSLLPALANRHGLITGATGTGKTVSLQTLAEQFSRIGVPVFLADVKGDLSGLAAAGGANAKVTERAHALGVELRYEAC